MTTIPITETVLREHHADPAAAEDITAAVAGATVTSWFADTVARHADAVALREDDGTNPARSWTWEHYAGDACRVAAGLRALGVGRGDRVALMMRNRPEFHLADMGAMLLAATPFSVYNSSPPEQLEYLLSHSEARVMIVEDAEFLGRVRSVRDRLPALEHILVLDPVAATDGVGTFADLLAADPLDLQAACGAATPQDVAMLVYTSGTTGPPKGAMATHGRICWIMESYRRGMGIELAGKRLVSYLPMAHVLERDVGHYLHVLVGAEVTTCADPTQIGAYLRRVRPHFFAAVPRVWEKLSSALRGAQRTPDEARAFAEALEIGARAARLLTTGQALDDALAAELLQADADVLRPARALLGLDACESAFSGGAPLPGETLEFFLALGVPLGEGYGLTESTFVVTFDHVRPRRRAVGRVLPGVELAIAADGEVLVRGPFVFHGYLKDEVRTAEAIDPDGWLHTGDIGKLDDDGYLWIVDRKKELIITAGGKNVSPANLEAAMKAHPLIGQACVIGDNRPYLVGLVVLDPEVAPVWARDHGLQAASIADLATDPRVRRELAGALADTGARFSRAERIKRFAILDREWLPDSDELTPTMKLKRRGILARHGAVIDAIYAGDPAVVIEVDDRSSDRTVPSEDLA